MSPILSCKARVREMIGLSKRKAMLNVNLHCVRPSLFDPRFTCDLWIADQGNGKLALRLGDYPLTEFRGLPLDVPALNQRLDQMWNSRPRGRSCLDRK